MDKPARSAEPALRRTHRPLERIRTGAIVLGVVFVGSAVGFRVAGYDWIESVRMTAITISTVGYGESSQSAPWLQLFTVLVIVVGTSAAVYTFGGFFQMVLEGELEQALGHRRMTRGIEQLDDHIIVCGFGRIGEVLARDLQRLGRRFVVIDDDVERFEDARRQNYLCLVGDAMNDAVLEAAGITRASTLVSALPGDADNVFITLTARNLNSSIRIIARAEQHTTEAKLRQAGADKIVMPAIIGAHRMERMITRPSTAHLMELVSDSSLLDLELDEFTLPQESQMIGLTVGAIKAHQRHRLLVAAVKQADGRMMFNPDSDYVYQAGDTLIVMGHVADIQRFQHEYQLGP